ncbi:MAG: O-antigen ligase family protein [Candidatus Omnitrophota bacterium]
MQEHNKIIKVCDNIIEWLIYISIFWMPFFKAGLEIGISLMFLVWVIKRVAIHSFIEHRSRQFRPVNATLNFAIGIFIAVAFVSVFQSDFFSKSLQAFFFRLLEWVFVYVVVIETINSKLRLERLGKAIVLSAVVVVINAIAQYIMGIDLICGRELVQGKITSCFGHFNTLAMYLGPIITIISSFMLYLTKNRWQKIFLTVLILLLVLCMIFSGSRGGWVSLFFALLLVGFLRDKRMFAILIIIAIIFLTTFLTNDRIRENNIVRFGDSGRILIWKASLNMFRERPVFGYGINTFMYNYPRFMLRTAWEEYTSDLPHNCYLMIAVEMGIVGFLAFLYLLYALFEIIFKSLARMPKQDFFTGVLTGLLGALICYLIHSFFDNNLQTMQTAFLFWFLVGVTIATISIWQNENKAENAS